MKKNILSSALFFICIYLLSFSCSSEIDHDHCMDSDSTSSEGVIAHNSSEEISCKLTAPELQERKETVLTSLKQQILESRELSDGYTFKFVETDEIMDELIEFLKGERACCGFFTFGITVGGDKNEIWLSITGPEGAKEMVSEELDLIDVP